MADHSQKAKDPAIRIPWAPFFGPPMASGFWILDAQDFAKKVYEEYRARVSKRLDPSTLNPKPQSL